MTDRRVRGEGDDAVQGLRGLTRRQLMSRAGTVAGAWLLAPGVLRAAQGTEAGSSTPYALAPATVEALRKSPLVYVSPLLASGAESRCHGEVWFFLDLGGVVIITASDGWKSRAVRRGRKRARLWVGNFGPVGRAGDLYRAAPSFEASAEIETRVDVFDRLMSTFAVRYPDEWAKWKPRFQKGHDDGSRVMIRYTPIGA